MRQSGLDKMSVGPLIDESIFTLGRLRGDPDTLDLVATVTPAHKGLKEAQAAKIEHADQAAMAEGGVQAVVVLAEREQTAVWLETKTITGNTREPHPLMVHLFPEGLTASKKREPEEVPLELARVAAAIKDDTDAVKLVPHVRTLHEREKAFDKPLAEMKQVALTGDKVRAQENKARNAYIEARDVLFGDLLKRFPRQIEYVNSFFRKHSTAKASDADEKKDGEKKDGEKKDGKSGKSGSAGKTESAADQTKSAPV